MTTATFFEKLEIPGIFNRAISDKPPCSIFKSVFRTDFQPFLKHFFGCFGQVSITGQKIFVQDDLLKESLCLSIKDSVSGETIFKFASS